MNPATIARLSEAVPRYTSYPTAPHFHPGIDASTHAGWLQALDDEPVSLYIHIPYCDRLCWFCACHTKMTRQYEPVANYLRALHQEIATVGRLTHGKARVRAVHLGGGSPTMLKPEDIIRLDEALRAAFVYLPDVEISVEIEANDMDEARFDALAAIGMTRASLGVQDFDPRVQGAINREQSFDLTKSVVEAVRSRGVRSVNLDLLYGLPHQTKESVTSTVRQALTLRPDRIALFGYAHVPWFKKHQTMIEEAWLPKAEGRLEQSLAAADVITGAGYLPIGFDHFARPDDTLAIAMAEGRLKRNFQGYTDDSCETLIGLGPSSISRFRQGYVQNQAATGEYEKVVATGGLASVRGIAFTADDAARGWVIERLMCDFAFSAVDLVERHGDAGQSVLSQASRLARTVPGELKLEGDRFVVPREKRLLIRTIAAHFDRYLETGMARHSVAV